MRGIFVYFVIEMFHGLEVEMIFMNVCIINQSQSVLRYPEVQISFDNREYSDMVMSYSLFSVSIFLREPRTGNNMNYCSHMFDRFLSKHWPCKCVKFCLNSLPSV